MDLLAQFNQQILQCQDDAYTLAWYLLEDEVAAETVLQAAVEAAYHCFSPSQADGHLRIMQQLVDQFRKRKRSARNSKPSGQSHPLHFIAENERLVVVLIDLIGLDYAAAAFIMGCSRLEIGCLLAHARWKMKDQQQVADR